MAKPFKLHHPGNLEKTVTQPDTLELADFLPSPGSEGFTPLLQEEEQILRILQEQRAMAINTYYAGSALDFGPKSHVDLDPNLNREDWEIKVLKVVVYNLARRAD